MTYQLFTNILLFSARSITAVVSFILLFNLLADWRNVKQKNEENGLRTTRIALLILVGSVLLENIIYGLAYIHGGFQTIELQAWLGGTKPVLILVRFGVAYGVFRLYLLFADGRKTNV
jgi:hypothetical protein